MRRRRYEKKGESKMHLLGTSCVAVSTFHSITESSFTFYLFRGKKHIPHSSSCCCFFLTSSNFFFLLFLPLSKWEREREKEDSFLFFQFSVSYQVASYSSSSLICLFSFTSFPILDQCHTSFNILIILVQFNKTLQ